MRINKFVIVLILASLLLINVVSASTNQTRIVNKTDSNPYALEMVFARGTDGALWYRVIDGMIIEDWKSLGGKIIGDPDAVSSSPDHVEVFVRGTDNALWQRSWDGTAWNNWQNLGGVLSSGPGADVSSSGRITVYVAGTDYALYYKYVDPGFWWSTWKTIGGTVTSDPDATATSINKVVARGTDNAVWLYANGWKSLGGITPWYSGPSITKTSSILLENVEVFTAGTDAALWAKSYDQIENTWGSWKNLGGIITSSPDSTFYGTGYIDVATQGKDNAVWVKSYSPSSGWSDWWSLGGNITSGPSIVAVET